MLPRHFGRRGGVADLTFGNSTVSLPPFRPIWPMRSGFAQTVAVPLLGGRDLRGNDGCRRLVVAYEDGTGDRTDAYYQPAAGGAGKSRPAVVLFHGLGGDASTAYVTRSAANLLGLGFDVMTPNFRGSGTAAELAREFHHPGRSEDVRLFFDGVRGQFPEFADREFVVVAFSLGGHVMLKYLADAHSPERPQGVVAGVTISAPLSLDDTSRRLSTAANHPFCRYILHKMKTEYSRANGAATDEQRAAMQTARTVWQFDEAFTSKYLGYDSAADFYAAMSAVDELRRIEVPTVLISAEDDPFVSESYYRDAAFGENRFLSRVVTDNGGHCGFFEGRRGKRWLDRTLETLIDSKFWTL